MLLLSYLHHIVPRVQSAKQTGESVRELCPLFLRFWVTQLKGRALQQLKRHIRRPEVNHGSPDTMLCSLL